jgi:hypothetical protein
LRQDEGVGSVVDEVIVKRFENVIAKGETILAKHVRRDTLYTTVASEPFAEWRSQGLTLLKAAFGKSEIYIQDFERFTTISEKERFPKDDHVEMGQGTLRAALEDFKNGYMWTIRERVHREVFDDFLEQAAYFVKDGGYADAAIVIAVGALEEHLRQLCAKSDIETTTTKSNGKVEPKKTATMNEELWKKGVYDQAEWRQINAWLDIRNDPAHGHYEKYSAERVEQMIDGIRGFLSRNPA